MQGLLRISSGFSEPWVAWTMLLLLLLLLIDMKMEPGLLLDHCRDLLSRKERDNLFNESTGNTLGRVCLLVFKAGVFVMAIYLCCEPVTALHGWHYLLLFSVWAGIAIVKYLLERLVMYVFLTRADYAVARRQYDNLTTCLCALLYPIVLLVLFFPIDNLPVVRWMFIVVAIVFVVVYLLKSMQLFFRKILAGLYIFLYLCTLEILPVLGFLCIAMQIVE